MRTKHYTVIDYNELDSLAQKIKPGFDFIADHEANNDTSYSFTVDELDVAGFQFEWLKLKHVSVHNVITALVVMGDIPMGNILVEVCW